MTLAKTRSGGIQLRVCQDKTRQDKCSCGWQAARVSGELHYRVVRTLAWFISRAVLSLTLTLSLSLTLTLTLTLTLSLSLSNFQWAMMGATFNGRGL